MFCCQQLLPLFVLVASVPLSVAGLDSGCLVKGNVQGDVQGVYFDKYPSCRYLGIPYAEPPVGPLRFEPPVSAGKFKSTPFAATKFSAGCPTVKCGLQHPEMTCPEMTSEDCLYLNVFTPPGMDRNSNLPVMLWIHGGNYIYGSGGVKLYDGARWSSVHNVVIVTINYRLGVLGGLFTSAKGAQGNYNLQDQRLTMMWVKDNIAAYGGNPNKVTIYGQSAGGFSVASHLASPRSWPYFHRAIAESDPYALPTVNDKDTAILIGDGVAKYLGCTDADSQKTCLKDAKLEDIVGAQNVTHFPTSLKNFLYKPMPWTPVVESDVKDPEMPMSPIDAAMSGNFNKVPIMIGTVSNESVQFVWEVSRKPMSKAEYELFVTGLFGPKHAKHLFQLYGPPPKKQVENKDVRFFLSELATDYIFTCPIRWAGKGYAKKVDAYIYNFAHLLTYNKWLQNATDPECNDYVCHASELPILFNSEYLESEDHPLPTAQEHTLSHQMQTVWSNFATSGDPNSPHPIPVQKGRPTNLHFPKFDFNEDTVLQFDIPTALNSNRRKKFCDYFDTIGYNRTG